MSDAVAAAIALIHVYVCYMESFLWSTPKGAKLFQLTKDQQTAGQLMAYNQGFSLNHMTTAKRHSHTSAR